MRSPNQSPVNPQVRRIREQNGAESHVGYKVGCTGEKVRRKLGIGDAVFGNLWGADCITVAPRRDEP